jgi:putative membrane protein
LIVRQDLLQIVRGFLMGGADAIPGVSGGTVALILGIYPRLVRAISRFDLTLLGFVKGGEIREAAVYVDLRFLAFLLVGFGGGIAGLMTTMHYLLEHELERTYAAFFGMIVASCLVVGRLVGGFDTRRILALLLGAVFAYWVVGLPFLENPPDSLPWLFFCGVVAICAMILPGISGAFILLILGAYYEVTGVVKALTQFQAGAEDIQILLTFAAGAGLGIVAFSKFLNVLLAKARGVTMAALAGFMFGSLRKIWPFKTDVTPTEPEFKLKQFENHWPDLADGETWFTLLVLVGAGAFVLLLERLSVPSDPDGTSAEV